MLCTFGTIWKDQSGLWTSIVLVGVDSDTDTDADANADAAVALVIGDRFAGADCFVDVDSFMALFFPVFAGAFLVVT